jgi:hypothetical protein
MKPETRAEQDKCMLVASIDHGKLRFWACLTSPSSFGGAKPRAAGDRDAGSRHPAGYAA